jgi:hypothetical protein
MASKNKKSVNEEPQIKEDELEDIEKGLPQGDAEPPQDAEGSVNPELVQATAKAVLDQLAPVLQNIVSRLDGATPGGAQVPPAAAKPEPARTAPRVVNSTNESVKNRRALNGATRTQRKAMNQPNEADDAAMSGALVGSPAERAEAPRSVLEHEGEYGNRIKVEQN